MTQLHQLQFKWQSHHPPIKLIASVVSSTQINLKWSAPVEDGNTPITGYKIEVKKDNRFLHYTSCRYRRVQQKHTHTQI